MRTPSTVELAGERHAVDTGFIVYNEKTYPSFTRLLAELGVETQPSEMSFGLACERTGLEWASRGVRERLRAAARTCCARPSFACCATSCASTASRARSSRRGEEKATLGDYLCGAGYSREFVEHYVLPMGAAIWSADPDGVPALPGARASSASSRTTGCSRRRPSVPWRVVAGRLGPLRRGARRAVPRIVSARPVAVRALAAPAAAASRSTSAAGARGASTTWCWPSTATRRCACSPTRRSASGACWARSATSATRSCSTPTNPCCRGAGAPGRAGTTASRASAAAPRARHLRHEPAPAARRAPPRSCVTLNGADRIDPDHVLRALRLPPPGARRGARSRRRRCRAAISGRRRTHYCGAYWGYGFHEDGVQSALAVCARLGAEAEP